MNTTPTGNEAEFQAGLVARIQAALPLLPANIKVERYLHLRLGHRALNIDGTAVEPGVRAQRMPRHSGRFEQCRRTQQPTW